MDARKSSPILLAPAAMSGSKPAPFIRAFTSPLTAADKATSINDSYDLNAIETSAADELYHRNKPILSVVDIDSRFCALLTKADGRDQDTWGIYLLDLQAGFVS